MESLRKGVYASMQKLSLGIVWRELQVFSKLLYRGKNQHRRDKSFQRLLRVSKDLHKYQAVSLSNHVKKVWKSLPQGSESLSIEGTKCISQFSNRLTECAHSTAHLLEFIEITFTDVHTRLCMSLFIPFNLLMVSSLSRLWYCLRYHLHAISVTYSMLQNHLPDNKPLSSVVSSLSHRHRHYLTEPLPASAEDGLGTAQDEEGLGTAVLRISCTKIPSEVQSPVKEVAKASPPPQNMYTACSLLPAVAHIKSKIKDSQVADLNSKRNRRIRRPNAITCLVKTGRGLAPLRIRCSRYLKTKRFQTCFRVRLACVKRCNPWRYCAAARVVKIQPLVAGPNKSHHQQLFDIAAVQPMTSDINNSNDIDSIFSVLTV